ncbi:GH32 C-terminal domain-containing protein [Geodermatophilus sp. SYSU D00758]
MRVRPGRRAAPLVALALLTGCTSADDGTVPAATTQTPPLEQLPSPALGLYTEELRPQFHWSPPFGWMNDPNGLVRVDGEYHLFFQYNPYSVDFGRIGWGHAVSTDLVHWQPLPVALAPTDAELIFSGSIVVDRDDTSGLCAEAEPGACLVAIYTTHRDLGERTIQTQDVAVSTDRGRTWTKYEGNPVLDLGLTDFRDPKVFWHEPTASWVMVVVLPIERQVLLYRSPDLLAWEPLSEFGPAGAVDGIWECPDLFPLTVEGTEDTRWVMKVDLNPGHVAGGSGGQYFVGRFDGTTFVPDEPDAAPLWVDYGRDFYCATTFAEGVDEPGRQLWLGWLNDWLYAPQVPTYPWRGSMTLARELSLVPTPDGPRLAQEPAGDLEALRTGEVTATGSAGELTDALAELDPDELDAFEARLALGAGAGSPVELRLLLESGDVAATVRVLPGEGFLVERPDEGNLEVAPTFPGPTPVAPTGAEDPITLHVLRDRNSLEVFGADGRSVITELVLPAGDVTRVEVVGGDGADLELDLRPLAGAY